MNVHDLRWQRRVDMMGEFCLMVLDKECYARGVGSRWKGVR
jgi:hypothetical protein